MSLADRKTVDSLSLKRKRGSDTQSRDPINGKAKENEVSEMTPRKR